MVCSGLPVLHADGSASMLGWQAKSSPHCKSSRIAIVNLEHGKTKRRSELPHVLFLIAPNASDMEDQYCHRAKCPSRLAYEYHTGEAAVSEPYVILANAG
jgi:hypothetical protein